MLNSFAGRELALAPIPIVIVFISRGRTAEFHLIFPDTYLVMLHTTVDLSTLI